MKINGNKILKKMKTRWMSMLDPLKSITVEYKSLLAIMQAHQNSIQTAKVNETSHVQIVFYDSQYSKTYQ
jgi:hypothetical protein